MNVTAKELLQSTLKAKVALAPLDARILLLHALEISLVEFIAEPNQPVTKEKELSFNALIERRLLGEPVSQIVQHKEFWSLPFFVNSDVLTPRPDSEAVIELALEQFPKDRALNILDIGTGSGCLIAALLSEFPNAKGVALDKSAAALKVAEHNFAALNLQSRVEVRQGDFTSDLSGQFDLIVSNPPYIAEDDAESLAVDVREYEPHIALFATGDGYDAYKSIIPQLPGLMNEGACVIFEVGAGQAARVRDLLKETMDHASWEGRLIEKKDLAGIERAIGFRL